jgi:hypothetical protein
MTSKYQKARESGILPRRNGEASPPLVRGKTVQAIIIITK